MSVTTCEAVREGDEMVCVRCRVRWDIDDPERPECKPIAPVCKSERTHYCGCRFDTVTCKWTFACSRHQHRTETR